MGIGCSKYTKFFKNVRGDPLQTYLLNMEDDTHGIFHFTFAGVGGDKAYAAVETLINTYGFSYSNIGALTVSAQHYFKKQLAGEIANFPVNCTVDPWQGNQLMSAAIPGDVDGPTCDFAETYYDTETTLDTLVASFVNFDPDETDLITRRLQGMSFAERAGAMKTIANMFPIDGDLASSGGGEIFVSAEKLDKLHLHRLLM